MQTGSKSAFRVMRYVRNIGKYRDGAFAFVSLIYLIGYLVWFVISWYQGLGPIPVLNTQYLVAGSLVLILIGGLFFIFFVLAWLLLRFVPARLRRLDSQELSSRSMNLRVPALAIGIALLFSMLASRITSKDYFGMSNSVKWFLGFIVVGCGVVSLAYWYELTRRRISAGDFSAPATAIMRALIDGLYTGFVRITTVYAFLLGICLLCIGGRIYVKTPQEFGGAKPRIAQLNVVCDSISPEIVQQLTDKPVPDPNQKIVWSKRIAVLFAASDRLIINPAPDDPNSVDRMEISRDVIKAIVWCRDKKTMRKPVKP